MLQSREFKELRKPPGYPKKIVTIGDHLRAARLDRGMTQKQAAEIMEVDEFRLLGWEKNQHEPTISAYKKIIDFLGYRPDTTGLKQRTFGERLISVRRSLGLTQANAAQLIGIDPSTLSRYERNVKVPEPELILRMEKYLDQLNGR